MQVILTKLKEQDPVLAASVSKLELMVRPCLHWYRTASFISTQTSRDGAANHANALLCWLLLGHQSAALKCISQASEGPEQH